MQHEIDCHGLTDRGLSRPSNQDQFLVADLVKTLRIDDSSLNVDAHRRISGNSQGKLMLVADGMGGHSAGERASKLAIETISTYVLNTLHWFFRLEADREHDFESELMASLELCNRQIREEAEVVPGERGMGTTVTMAYLIWPRLYVVHAGDSRCYVYHESGLKRITEDHTFAEQLVNAGVLSPENADQSRWSNVLWNVVGGSEEDLHPVVYKCELAKGDTVLLCTDGLTRHLGDKQIEQVLSSAGSRSAKDICQQLIDDALTGGGKDNVTAIVARV
ncbi:MAG: serine/threonine-protein phosphatase [Planctomycetales bacterium]|nr:serine/threonine-protein phosphatase [Planctomycetales bacterium]